MAASAKWEQSWDEEVTEINEANATKAATLEPTVWRVSASDDTYPVVAEPLLDWPQEAWFPSSGVRMS